MIYHVIYTRSPHGVIKQLYIPNVVLLVVVIALYINTDHGYYTPAYIHRYIIVWLLSLDCFTDDWSFQCDHKKFYRLSMRWRHTSINASTHHSSPNQKALQGYYCSKVPVATFNNM